MSHSPPQHTRKHSTRKPRENIKPDCDFKKIAYQQKKSYIQQYLCHWKKNGNHKGLYREWKTWTFTFKFRDTIYFFKL